MTGTESALGAVRDALSGMGTFSWDAARVPKHLLCDCVVHMFALAG